MNKKFVDTIMYDITTNCNLRCRHCYNANFLSDENYVEVDVEKIFNAFSKIEFKSIVIQGGEPLMVSNLEELIEKFRQKGVNVFVTTNGTLLSKERISRFIKSGVTGVFFSVESDTPEVNDKIRGKGSFQTLYTNLKNFMSLYSMLLERKYIHPMLIALSTTVSSLNFMTEDKIRNFFIFADELNIKDINFNFLVNFGGSKQLNYNEHTTDFKLADSIIHVSKEFPHIGILLPVKQLEYEFFKKKYGSDINIYGTKKSCPAGDKIVYVDSNLNMLPCSWLLHLNKNIVFTKENTINLFEELPVDIFKSFSEQKKKCVSIFKECKDCKYEEMCIPICPCQMGENMKKEVCCPTRKEIAEF